MTLYEQQVADALTAAEREQAIVTLDAWAAARRQRAAVARREMDRRIAQTYHRATWALWVLGGCALMLWALWLGLRLWAVR